MYRQAKDFAPSAQEWVENEIHFLTECTIYQNRKIMLFQELNRAYISFLALINPSKSK
jgi:hypothetical protein